MRFTLVLISAISLMAFPAAAAPQQEAKLSPQTVAAVLNGTPITVAQVDEEIQRKPAFALQLSSSSEKKGSLNEVRLLAVQSIIDRTLLVDAARQSGVDEKGVQSSVEQVITSYGGVDKLSELLKAINTTYEKFRADISDDFRIQAMFENSLAKAPPLTEKQLRDAYSKNSSAFIQKESIRARHILRTVKDNATPEESAAVRTKIDEVYKRALVKDSDFAALAKENSECPSREQGGDLGFFTKGMMVPEFEKAAFVLSPGQISEPIRSQFGFHIIKLEERTPEHTLSFDEARPTLERQLTTLRRQELLKKKVEELRHSAHIEVKISAQRGSAS